jgi:hypothetical protein
MLKMSGGSSAVRTVVLIPIMVIPFLIFCQLSVADVGPMMSENPSTPATSSTGEVIGETTSVTCDEWWSPSSGLDRRCPIQSDDFKGPSNGFTITKTPDGTVTKISTYSTGEKNVETETPDGVVTFESLLKGYQNRIIFLNNPGGGKPDRLYENLKTGEANIELGNLDEEGEQTIDLQKISADTYSGKHTLFGTEVVIYRDSSIGQSSSGNWVTVIKDHPGGNTTTVYRNNDGTFKIINTSPSGFSTITVEKYDKNSSRSLDED